jgi:hypothetical protein
MRANWRGAIPWPRFVARLYEAEYAASTLCSPSAAQQLLVQLNQNLYGICASSSSGFRGGIVSLGDMTRNENCRPVAVAALLAT